MYEAGDGEPMKVGDRVMLYTRHCRHDAQGNEKRDPDFGKSSIIESLTPDHHLYQM